MHPIVSGGLLGLGIVTAFVLVLRSLLARKDFTPDPRWLDEFSVAKYRPMERLLTTADYEFLAAQPGYDPAIARNLRAQRRNILRAYLRALSRDFERLYQTAKLMALYAAEDRPDLASALVRQKLAFEGSLLAVRCRLVFGGIGLRTPDLTGLVRALESMRAQLPLATAAV